VENQENIKIFVVEVYCNICVHRCSRNTFSLFDMCVTVDTCNSIIMNNKRPLYNITR
jgi:hypothetical protein